MFAFIDLTWKNFEPLVPIFAVVGLLNKIQFVFIYKNNHTKEQLRVFRVYFLITNKYSSSIRMLDFSSSQVLARVLRVESEQVPLNHCMQYSVDVR